MAHVCPWWLGYLLVNPLRKWSQDPEKILSHYISEGMTVLEVGPGMGFFTLPAARLVGDSGIVIAVDIQEKMLKALIRRAGKAGVADRIIAGVCEPNSLGIDEPIDLCLAINVVHETPDPASLFAQIRAITKPAGRLLVSEPRGWHVSEEEFQRTVTLASDSGFRLIDQPKIPRSRTALFAA